MYYDNGASYQAYSIQSMEDKNNQMIHERHHIERVSAIHGSEGMPVICEDGTTDGSTNFPFVEEPSANEILQETVVGDVEQDGKCVHGVTKQVRCETCEEVSLACNNLISFSQGERNQTVN